MKQQLFAKKIQGNALSLNNNKNLIKKQSLQIGLNETITTKFLGGDYVILDFGQEMNGGIRILTYFAKNVRIRIRFGESITECCAELGGEKNATNDHSFRDFEASLTDYSDMSFGNTGFRFVRLDFYGEATIKTVVAVNHILKKRTIYQYEGSDERIRQIYSVAKRTVDLCAGQDFLWDGIKRDRLVWVGDIHPEMLALTTLYGRSTILERSLDFAREQAPLPGWMNNWFPAYSMWWIIILADYYEATNAKEYIKKQMDYLERLVIQIDSCIKEDGSFEYPGYFVDWPTSGQPDEVQGVRAINILAIKKAIFLLKEFERSSLVAERALNRLLLKKIDVKTSKQVAGLKYFAVGLDESDKKLLIEGGAKGMSTFMSYYILKAVASFDKTKAVAMMKEYYGGMLDKGATSFWEDFNVEWLENSSCIDEFPKDGDKDIHGDFGAYCYKGFRHSLCHGWSAGIIKFIQDECTNNG